MANSPDGTVGSFDLDRVDDARRAQPIPVYRPQGSRRRKDGLTAEDIVTNQFIDPTIGV